MVAVGMTSWGQSVCACISCLWTSIAMLKKSNQFMAPCKSVIRNIKSILAINALLICQRFFEVFSILILAR